MFVKACRPTVEDRSVVLLSAGDRLGGNSVISCIL